MTRLLADACSVPVQEFRNRADLPGGGTLGTVSATHVSVPAADIGIAQLAMHSSYETCSLADVAYLSTLATRFFSVSLTYTEDGARWE
jgi:aspartyl aminopeptidase